MEKEKILETVLFEENIQDKLPTNLEKLMQFFAEKINLIPQEFRSTAEIHLDTKLYYGNDTGLDMYIFYYRPETDEEFAISQKQLEDQKRAQESHELCLLEKLMAKYNVRS